MKALQANWRPLRARNTPGDALAGNTSRLIPLLASCRLACALLATLLVTAPASHAANVLVVIGSSSPSSAESQRITTLQGMGHTVTTIASTDSQANFDTAMAAVSAVYITPTATSVGYKVREATIGVFIEMPGALDEMGISTGSHVPPSRNTLTVLDTSHPILSDFTGSSTLSFTNSNTTVVVPNGTFAVGLQEIAQWNGVNYAISVVETGGTLVNTYNSSNTAFGRRVAMPLGSSFNWSDLTANGVTILGNAIDWLVTGSSSSNGKTVLLVVANSGSLTANESARQAQFEGWGYSVTTIGQSDSAANFDTAFAAADAAYVPETVTSSSVSYKLREATIGVIIEEVFLHNEMGFSSSDGSYQTTTNIQITDNSHSITSGISLGSVTFTTSSQNLAYTQGTEAAGAQALASYSGGYDLFIIESGGQLANTYNSSNTAFGRRVGLPIGDSFNWSSLSTNGLLIIERSLEWASEPPPVSTTGNVLFVRSGTSTYTTEEQARVDEFEGWGYTVNPIDDGASQATFNAAFLANDVVYVPESADAGSLAYKLREARIGVVHEGISSFDDNMGWTTSTGQNTNTCTTMTVINNTHPITDHFSTGTVTIFDSSTDSYGSQVIATVASGAEVLATNLCVNSGNANVLAMDYGAALANTYDDNGAATARRVRLPYGGFSSFSWSNVSADGLTMVHKALEWAADDGLVGHWKLDETSGTVAADSSGNGYDGTYTNSPTLGQTGVYGYAPAFNGSNQYVSVNEGADLNLQQSFTVACWAKSDTATWSGWGCLVSKRDQFYLHPDYGTTYIYLGANTTGAGDHSAGVDMATIGGIQDWHHYAGVYDYQNGVVRFYVDGVLRATTSLTAETLLESDTGALTIGWDDGIGGTRYFDGQIDDVRLYQRVLSDAEVTHLYGLVGHWKFDEGTGTTASDATLDANHASFSTGAPSWVTGVRGTALEFDGASEAVTGGSFDPPENGCVALWIRSDGPPASRQRPWGVNADFEMWQDSDGLVSMDLSTDGFQGGFITTTPTYDAGRWYHFVAQYNSDTDAYEIYLNGELHKSGVSSWDIQKQTAAVLTFGTRTGNTQRFRGAIDDFRIYDRWLSTREIAELYGLIGNWKLDETSGSVATDSSLAGNDGVYQVGSTPGGSGPFPGRGANAAAFDGNSGAQIALPTMDYDFSDGLTLAVWYKANSISGPYTDFLSLSNGSLVDDIWLGFDNTGGLNLFLSDTADGAAFRGIIEGSEPVLGEWRHAVAVIDASGNATLYHDGVAVQTGYTGLPRQTSRASNGLGETAFTHTLDGLLYDARVYNRPVTPAEIAQLYGQVGHYRLDETSGTVAADSSGMGNDGTYVNDPTLGVFGNGNYDLNTAMELDGTNYVEVPTLFDEPSSMTVMAWIRLDTPDSDGSEVISIGDYFVLRLDGISPRPGEIVYRSGGAFYNLASSLTHTGMGWRHVAATFDEVDNSVEVFVDGALVASDTLVGPLDWTGLGSDTKFGTNGNGFSGTDFTGRIDDVRIFNRSMRESEVQKIYGSTKLQGLRIINWVEAR